MFSFYVLWEEGGTQAHLIRDTFNITSPNSKGWIDSKAKEKYLLNLNRDQSTLDYGTTNGSLLIWVVDQIKFPLQQFMAVNLLITRLEYMKQYNHPHPGRIWRRHSKWRVSGSKL